MRALRKKFLIVLTLAMTIAGVVGGVLFYNLLPTEYFSCYPVIPMYFYSMGLLLVWVIKQCKHKTDHQILNIYLGLRIFKLFGTLLLMGIYMWIIDEKDKEFLITIGLFYFIYLVIETGFYFEFEKELKKRKTNEKLTQ